MPVYRRAKRNARATKRPAKKKAAAYRRYRRSVPKPLGFPKERSVTLKYVDTCVLDVGIAGVIAKHVYSANNIYDPDVTGTGHQPMMHDLWASLYNHYVVSGSKISVKIVSPYTAATTPTIVGCMVNDDTTTPTTWSDVLEQNRCKSVIAGGGDASKTKIISNTFSARKFYNVADVKDNFQRLGNTFGASPSEQAYYTLFALPYDQVTDTEPVRAVVTIYYRVLLSEPKDQAGS